LLGRVGDSGISLEIFADPTLFLSFMQSTSSTDRTPMATFVSIREASERSNTSYQHIGNLVRAQKINGRKSGNMWIVDLESLQEYEAKMRELGPQKHKPKSLAK
jgi:hypothetical protein